MMKTRLLITTLAAALLAGAVFSAQPGNDDRRNRRDGRPGVAGRDDGPRPDRRPPPPGRSGPGRMMSPGMGYGAGMGFPFRRLSDLDLTSEQRARIVEMLTANYKAMLEAGFMVNDAVSKLRELRGGGAGDEALIAAHRNLGEAMGRLQSLRGKAKEQIKDVLTDEQKAKLGKPGRRERFDDDRGCDYRGCDDRRPRDRRDDDRRWGGRRHRDRWDDIPRWDRRPPRDRRQNAGDDDVDDVDSLLDDDAVEDALEDALED